MYKGKPLVRENNRICYGDMSDKYYLFIMIMSESKNEKLKVALPDKVMIQIIDTKEEQIAMGVAIAKGVLKTLGVAQKEQEPAVKEEPKEETTGKVYRVQVGAYSQKANAEAMQQKLKAAGYDAIIV